MTKPISRKMAVDCLLFWNSLIIGNKPICCIICKEPCNAGDNIQFDHRHAIIFDGAHDYLNLAPVHFECHKIKTKADVQANAKIKRITGVTKGPRKKAWAKGRKLQSRPFQKRAT